MHSPSPSRLGLGLRCQSHIGPARSCSRFRQPDRRHCHHPPAQLSNIPNVRPHRPARRRPRLIRRAWRPCASRVLCGARLSLYTRVQCRGPSTRPRTCPTRTARQPKSDKGGRCHHRRRGEQLGTRKRALLASLAAEERSCVLDPAAGARGARMEGSATVRENRAGVCACLTDFDLGFFFFFRDKTFFLAHLVISAILGVFCGGLYWQTGDNIAGFQSRVGCLFFLVRTR